MLVLTKSMGMDQRLQSKRNAQFTEEKPGFLRNWQFFEPLLHAVEDVCLAFPILPAAFNLKRYCSELSAESSHRFP